ncbi:MAG: FkbM family methyltransferase, partial [Pseudomonadota bacterium]|nr:FkbM family methyltransferase [Pseudomonadota bacterium]
SESTAVDAVAGGRRDRSGPMHWLRGVAKRLRDAGRWNRYQRASFSQEGEDLVLARFFGERRNGFYVDVGAHHPHRFSNTFLFYQRGWRGLNLDAMPGSMAPFLAHRGRDINLEIPVLRQRQTMTYHQFRDPTLNGFSVPLSRERVEIHGCELLRTIELEGRPLAEILAEHVPPEVKTIDFLSVDVEGLDLEVLQSNDWQRFRPTLVLVELINSSLASVASDPVHAFMTVQGYEMYAKTAQTVFYLAHGVDRAG